MARKEQSECQIFNKGKPLWAKKGKWRTLPGFRGKLLRVLANAKVRGIPVGSVPLTPSEKQELLDKMQGHWKIQPLQGMGTNTIKHSDAFVHNEKIILSRGEVTISQGYQHHKTTKKITMEQKIIPFSFS